MAKQRGILYSSAFSCNWLITCMWSMVENPDLKPACSLGWCWSNVRNILRRITCENTLYVIGTKLIGLSFFCMSAVSPFLCIKITEAFPQLFGSLPSLRHLLNILVNIWMMGSPPYFKTSAVMLSFPGALFRFSRLMAALTSVGRMGGGGVFRVSPWICMEGCPWGSLVL